MNCYSVDTKWKTTTSLLNPIQINANHYCAFECQYHPYFCTHWAKTGNICILYFGNIENSSPKLIEKSSISGKEIQDVQLGTRLCRKGNKIISKSILWCIICEIIRKW